MTELLNSLAALPPAASLSLVFVFALLTGSFLNVVILRHPQRMMFEWTAQSHEWLHKEAYNAAPPPGLVFPASHCPKCKAPLKAWHNIPVLSFLFLSGRCANCQAPISWRYPAIELLTAVLSTVVIWVLGFTLQGFVAVGLTWVLIVLSFIDIDHQLLPDDIVLPVLWMCLLLSLVPVFVDPRTAIIGAAVGYLSFWSVYHIFRLATGKEGMGHGDFKLMALLGAWLGWEYLAQIILISTLVGSVFGIALMLMARASKDVKIPFGPYIALAGWIALLWGDQINSAYWRFAGL